MKTTAEVMIEIIPAKVPKVATASFTKTTKLIGAGGFYALRGEPHSLFPFLLSTIIDSLSGPKTKYPHKMSSLSENEEHLMD